MLRKRMWARSLCMRCAASGLWGWLPVFHCCFVTDRGTWSRDESSQSPIFLVRVVQVNMQKQRWAHGGK